MNTSVRVDTSVIICAYTEERWDDLRAAVSSVRAQSVEPREIIVVIDHNDRLLERARAEWADVTVIENREARGLSGARNSAIKQAHGSLVAFLDDDAVAAPDWLERLVQACDDPAVLGVGGAIEPAWRAGLPAWFPDEFNWVVGGSYRGLPLTRSAVRNLIGCSMCIRREVFDAVGNFRTEVGRIGKHPVGCEETELCIRARQHWPERTFLYEPEARVRHMVPASRANWTYFRSRCYFEGRSKALVTQLAGAGDALSSERTYTRSVLPRGVARNLAQAVTHRDPSGVTRAAAIVLGLASTVTGYGVGVLLLTAAPWKARLRRAGERRALSGRLRPYPASIQQEDCDY